MTTVGVARPVLPSSRTGWWVVYVAGCAALAAAVLALPLGSIFALLGGLVGAALLVRSERDTAQLLVAYTIVVAVVPAALVVPALGSVGTPQILLGLTLLAVWGVTWLAPRQVHRARFRLVPLLLVGFAVVNLASFLAASLRPTDVLERTAADRGAIMIVAATGVALLAAEAVADLNRLDAVVKGIVVGGAIIAAVGIVQFTTGLDPAAAIRLPGFVSSADQSFIAQRSTFRRVSGTTVHAIEFSAVLCMALPLAVHQFRRQGRSWFAPLVLIAVALPMSVSRTAVVGLAAALVIMVPSWPKRVRRRAYLAGGTYLVLMRLAVPGLLGTIKSLFVDAPADPSIQSRQTDYLFVTTFIHERPWFGRGYTTFIPVRYDFLDNQYLLAVVETGYVGAAMYITLLVGSIAAAWQVRRQVADQAARDLAQALIASLAVAAATSMAFDFLSFPTVRATLFLAVGCVGALGRLTVGSVSFTPGHTPNRAAALSAFSINDLVDEDEVAPGRSAYHRAALAGVVFPTDRSAAHTSHESVPAGQPPGSPIGVDRFTFDGWQATLGGEVRR